MRSKVEAKKDKRPANSMPPLQKGGLERGKKSPKQTKTSKPVIPDRYARLHVFTNDPKKRVLIEELGTAESLVRDLARALQACVTDLEIAQAEICEFAPSVKPATNLLSRIPKELK